MSSETDPITAAIVAAIRQVLHDTGREPGSLEAGMLLAADLGLDSLDLAQTVVLLERSLGVDPFRVPPPGSGRPAIRSVADLAGIYSQAISGPAAPNRTETGKP
jgi:acyl carrier protein